MIRLNFFDNNYSNIAFKITRYVNDNLKVIIDVLIDFLEDDNDFSVQCFLPKNNMKVTDDEWFQLIYDLSEIVSSDVIRDFIKPKYEYLIYEILVWWEECADCENDLLPVELSSELKSEILNSFSDKEQSSYILRAITSFYEYYNFLFEDYDFFPDSLSSMVSIYIKSPELFKKLFVDVNLDEYYDLMPRDLRERYDEINNNSDNTETEINIPKELEHILYNDIIFCCRKISSRRLLVNADEDDRNDELRDLLESREKYTVKDQSRQGSSNTGKRSGEVDLLIQFNGDILSIIEGLNLECVDTFKISYHIDKIYKYDTIGYKYNYLISYVKNERFNSFVKRYEKFIKSYSYPYTMIGFDAQNIEQYSELRTFVVNLNREGIMTKLYHILIHIQD